jgi:hypothetical protein
MGNTSGMDPLEHYRITSVPESMYYIPNFLSPEECTALLSKVSF